MNFLAHAMLSPDDDLVMVGNLMGDFVRNLEGLPPRLRRGVMLHRRIDSTANAHPAFRRSAQRLHPTLGHYARAVLDIFYDYVLAVNIEAFSHHTSLDAFVQSINQRFLQQRVQLPNELAQRWSSVTWLMTYAQPDGVTNALRRLSMRSRHGVDLTRAMPLLHPLQAALTDDLHDLFPDLATLV